MNKKIEHKNAAKQCKLNVKIVKYGPKIHDIKGRNQSKGKWYSEVKALPGNIKKHFTS